MWLTLYCQDCRLGIHLKLFIDLGSSNPARVKLPHLTVLGVCIPMHTVSWWECKECRIYSRKIRDNWNLNKEMDQGEIKLVQFRQLSPTSSTEEAHSAVRYWSSSVGNFKAKAYFYTPKFTFALPFWRPIFMTSLFWLNEWENLALLQCFSLSFYPKDV